MPWKKGQSGNPNGRSSGVREKLTRKFFADFHNAWERGGPKAIERVCKDDPATFLRVAASLMPKEMEATIRTVAAAQLSDDELADIALGSSEAPSTTPSDPPVLN